MPGHWLTQSQYAHHKLVERFGELIVHLDEQALTDTSQVVWLVVISIDIGFPEHRFISTGIFPFEEYSEDRLFPGQE